ncbi:MAG: hypothetical protein LRY62_04245 [Alphaproteobacteria bacterium]|nr:hypothetical protein [Alphaproteobacteria bacterium]
MNYGFVKAMQAAWCRETCWEGCTDEYDAAENPAEGQCLVTTLAAWADNGFADYLQTVLVQADVHPPRPPVWHFNLHHSRLGLYEFDIDPTSQQFPRGSRYATVSRVSIASRQHHEIVYGSLFEPQAAASLERRLTLFLSRMENPGGYKINTSAADILARAEQYFDYVREWALREERPVKEAQHLYHPEQTPSVPAPAL